VLVLVLVNQNFIGTRDEDEYNDEGGSCRAVSLGFHIVSQKVTGVRNGDRGSGLRAYSIGIAIFQFFFPPPKVDSTVIEARFKSTAVYGPHDEAMLFAVIKAAFGNRRKTLKNALAASGLGIDSQTALEALKSAGIDPSRRAETLKPAEFVSLEISLRKALE